MSHSVDKSKSKDKSIDQSNGGKSKGGKSKASVDSGSGQDSQLRSSEQDDNQNESEVSTVISAVLRQEAAAISAAAERIDSSVSEAIELLASCQGRVIVTGMGKMGCIARKAAATFCSTGTPAIFLHPGEAIHGDLGIVTQNDVLVLLSKSGQTRELCELLPHVVRMGVPIIGLIGDPNSPLAGRCSVVVDTSVESEADPISVAPTSSTTVALAMSDALAVALMQQRGFTKEQFAIFHPGGNLGGKLLIQVGDLMRTGDEVPTANTDDTLQVGIDTISAKGLGAVFVVSQSNEVLGVLTDGDLRRLIQQTVGSQESQSNPLTDTISSHMTSDPKSIQLGALAAEALRLMEDNGITILPVVKEKQLVGVIHLHDLIRAGLA